MNIETPNASLSDSSPTKKSRIFWSDAEWDKVLTIVIGMRHKDPSAPMSRLIRNAQSQIPESRRRKFQGPTFKTFTARMQEKQKELSKNGEQPKITPVAAAPTRASIIESLSDGDILTLFKHKVMEQLSPLELIEEIHPEVMLDCIPLPKLIGYTVEKLLELWLDKREARQVESAVTSPPAPVVRGPHVVPPVQQHPIRTQQPKIAIFGALPNQENIIVKEIGDEFRISFVTAKQHVFPADCNLYVAWAKFISHSLFGKLQTHVKQQKSRLLVHHGGVNQMIEKIKKEIKNA